MRNKKTKLENKVKMDRKEMNKKKMKMKNNNTVREIIISGVVLLVVLSFVILVSVLTNDERSQLQSELNNLTSSLSNLGYEWLVGDNLNIGGNIQNE